MRTLSDLPLGKRARIGRVCLTGAMGRRLSELGFLPGSGIACRICDTLIALRGRDARHIELDEIPEKGGNAP